MSSTPLVIVGGSVAALTAADALARQGHQVDLFVPERGVGGGFLPFERDGRRLDLGPRVIELQYDDAGPAGDVPPWSAYRPGPHGHRPFLAAIDAFVADLAGDDLVSVSPPQVSVGRRRTTDYALAGDLSGLHAVLDPELSAAMAAETADRVRVEGDHGWFSPERGGLPWDQTYAQVSEAHCGATFHNTLIDPIAAKILPGGTGSVLAPLHRKIWMPLFHPITAHEAVTDMLSYHPDRPFATIAGGGMGEIVRRLYARVSAAPQVTLRQEGALIGIEADGDGTILRFASGASVAAPHPISGVGADELFAAAGIAYEVDKIVTTMVWLDVPDTQVQSLPSVLYAAEPDIGVFRVTESIADAAPGRRTVCCEVAWSVPADQREAVAVEALVELGVVAAEADPAVVACISVPAFAVPSGANRDRFLAARTAFDALGLSVEVVAGPTAFGVDTFNEQVVQGLAAAARLAS